MNGTVLRRWHTYIGLLCAPSLIFMCLTGAVQLFSLHEAHGDYHPYAWVEKLSSVHKDQALEHHHAHQHADAPAPPDAKPAAEPPGADHDHDHDHDESTSVGTRALKVFLLLVALGLTASASLGLWIALTQSRQRKLCWVLLGCGTVLPLVFVVLG
ncbi:MAG TPA: PepSY domain-containing protein [Steroidobacteraceae bacterium]|nr:PepSY domain-containing protein [Steroidobacteraceae bacterium]